MAETNESEHSLPVISRKKRFHHKVTSGCSTCRARRVKCDEAKPACLRCTKTGRTCPGYGLELTVSQTTKPLKFHRWTPKVIAPSTYKSTDEARDLSFFLQRSAPMISMASGASDLWTVIIPQVSWAYPEIREMLYAFSCLDQHFMSSSTSLDMRGPYKPALQHFNKAIRGLTNGVPALHNILLSSLVGWMFEITMCNYDKAKIHLDAAQQILKEFDERDRGKSTPADYDVVVEAVRAVEFDPHWREFQATQDAGFSPDEFLKMDTLEDAWTTVEEIMRDDIRPDLEPSEVALARRRMLLWRMTFIEKRFDLSQSTAGVPLSAKRPIVLLHTIGSMCLELQSPQRVESVKSRRKQWETAVSDLEKIIQSGYGERIEKGAIMLLDVIMAQADPELEVSQRACRLRKRLKAN